MKNIETTIVLPRTEPDLDGVACAVAYAELLNATGALSKPWYKEIPDAEAKHLINLCKSVLYAGNNEVENAKQFILVDASGLEGLPSEVDPANITEVIDHRFHHKAEDLFPNAKIQIESVGAAATLIAEKYMAANIIPSHDSGLMLYGAIHSNTQCLKGTITSDRDRFASNWLEQAVFIPKNFLEEQFAARRDDLIQDIDASIRRERKEYVHPTGEYAISQLEFHGSGKVLKERIRTISDVINELTPRTALNMVDLDANCSYIYVVDEGLKSIFTNKIGLFFSDDIAISDGIILRKQIVDKIVGV